MIAATFPLVNRVDAGFLIVGLVIAVLAIALTAMVLAMLEKEIDDKERFP